MAMRLDIGVTIDSVADAPASTDGNPTPTLSGVSPSSANAGASNTPITLTGTGFIVTSTVFAGATSLATTYSSPTSLSATIPSSLLTSGGTFLSITVSNPGPGGGNSSAQTFTVNHLAPTLGSISPASVSAGAGNTTVTFTGTNYDSSSVVYAGATPLTTTYVSSTQVTAVVPSSLLTTGGATVSLTVQTPTPGGGTSASKTLTVNHLAPTLSSISPTFATAGAGDTTITLTGTNYDTATVTYAGATALTTTFVSATSVTAAIPSSLLTTGGNTLAITAQTPSPGGGTSASQTFTVNHLSPTLSSVSPSTITVGSGNTTITCTGTGYDSSSVVYAGATALTTTYGSSASLTATVPSSLLTATGTLSITVQTPTPGGGTSGAQSVAVNNPVPTLSSISSTTAQRWDDSGNTRTLAGTGYVSGATVTYGSTSGIATTSVTSTSATFVLPASELDDVGTKAVTITNPTPGGGTSSSLSTTVVQPTYALKWYCPDESVTLNGSNAQVIPNQITGDTAANISQLTAGLQPAVVTDTNYNSRKVVSASGASGMTSSTFGTTVTQSYTMMVVGEHSSASTVMVDGGGSTSRAVFSTVAAAAATMYAGGSVLTATGVTVTRGIYFMHFAGASSAMRKNTGSSTIVSGSAGTQSMTAINLFQAYDGSGKSTARMYAIGIFSGVLTQTQMDKIGAAMTRKTGLSFTP